MPKSQNLPLPYWQIQFLKDADDFFSDAHERYRAGKIADAVHYCRLSFEATMKCICDAKGWKHKRATATVLINILIEKKFFPSMLESYFGNLKGLLECCAPVVVPNSTASHAPDKDVPPVTDELAAYVLHQTAANIVFLVQTFERNKE